MAVNIYPTDIDHTVYKIECARAIHEKYQSHHPGVVMTLSIA